MESVYLAGSEAVSHAGSAMRQAAQQMTTTANSLDESLRTFQRFMEDWLQRFEAVIDKAGPNTGGQ